MASGEGADCPRIEVTRIDASPNQCSVSEKLDLEMDFTTDREFEGHWDVSYIVDGMRKRYIVHLGKTTTETYKGGQNTMKFHASTIDVSDIKPSALSNAGMLCASLYEGSTGIADVKMVVNVHKDKDGEFIRTIYNPLE
eukprot:gb/GECG01006845.1/.p1 GENE.gb/GECG01006845.1/~~gb/GECG01006845.1/.p1  ORF type:complete len:139 (+),score=11.70 gb/GECG01006845.1/:1-417(+)